MNNSNFSVTLENRPKSSILKLGQGVMRIHPCDKFELSGLKTLPVISQTSQTWWIIQIGLWPWK